MPLENRVKELRAAKGLNQQELGALVGDVAEVGCNSVLCPGSVLGRGCQVYPTSCVRGVVPAGHIYKGPGKLAKRV